MQFFPPSTYLAVIIHDQTNSLNILTAFNTIFRHTMRTQTEAQLLDT